MYSRFFDTAPSLKTAAFLLIYFLLLGLSGMANAQSFHGIVVRVKDGDSIVVKTASQTVEIRLYGIDSPEYGQPYGEDAKRYMNGQVLHKSVKVTPYYRDSYGRTVAMVARGDTILNEKMIAQGLAWVYPRFCRKRVCRGWQRIEKEARAFKLGLWQDQGPTAPWQWKRQESWR